MSGYGYFKVIDSLQLLSFKIENYLTTFRALVRAGASAAWALTEIWQRVPGTRPDKGTLLPNSKKAPKL